MNLKPNDRIKIGDREVTILSRIAAGKHVRFDLSDGTAALDLDSNDQVELLDRTVLLPDDTSVLLSKDDIARVNRPFPSEPGYEATRFSREEDDISG